MFIFFGEREQAIQITTSQFDCPVCQQSTQFTHHQVQCHFTIFGVKVAQLPIASNYVVCHICSSCFDPKILNDPQEFTLAVDKASLIRTLCYLLSGYGDTQQSRDRLIAIYKCHANIEITDHNIDTELFVIRSGNAPTLPFLKKIAHLLSPKAKQDIIIACYQFSVGSCMMEHHDRVRINTLASSINISLPEVEYLINQQ